MSRSYKSQRKAVTYVVAWPKITILKQFVSSQYYDSLIFVIQRITNHSNKNNLSSRSLIESKVNKIGLGGFGPPTRASYLQDCKKIELFQFGFALHNMKNSKLEFVNKWHFNFRKHLVTGALKIFQTVSSYQITITKKETFLVGIISRHCRCDYFL